MAAAWVSWLGAARLPVKIMAKLELSECDFEANEAPLPAMNPAIREKIVSLEGLLPRLAEFRRAGRRIVQCHGCFDVVHPGHVRHLADAAALGDVLVVSVTADPQVEKLAGRPFVPQELRCENLAALAMVDFVLVDAESWAGPLLQQVRPDFYVKGLEYQTNNDPRFLKEKEIVERQGGAVVYTSGEVVYSSTRLKTERLDGGDLDGARLRTLFARRGIDRESLLARLRRFQDLSLVVVGDLVVDHYVECEQQESTTEAPMLQVAPIGEKRYLGGAGVLALHAAALGARATYVGFLPVDRPVEGMDLSRELESRGVRVVAIPVDVGLVKTRYLVEGQKVFKVNRCRPLSVSTAQEGHWLQAVDKAFADGAQGLVAVDFGYGSLTRPRMRRAAEIVRNAGARLFADTSSNRTASLGKFFGLGCDCIYPNEAEARAYLGEPELGLPLLASKLFAHNMAQAIALTLGARGLVLFERSRRSIDVDGGTRYLPEYLPSLAPFAVDPLGAGDALTTLAALARLAGADHVEALVLGSLAAAVAVGRLGNEPVGLEPLLRFLLHHPLFADAAPADSVRSNGAAQAARR